jgi:hypothetical protein
MNYETTSEIEIAVGKHFNHTYLVVPNVSWGMFNYELDLCMLNYGSLYATEVEIKVSRSDLKADMKKRHHHDSNKLKYVYFAMPEKLKQCEDLLEARFGIIYVSQCGNVYVNRKPQVNPNARPWELKDAFRLSRLGMFRLWDMKDNARRRSLEYRQLYSKYEELKTRA